MPGKRLPGKESMSQRFDAVYDQDFGAARGRAWRRAVRAWATGQPNRLLSFEEVRHKLHLGGPIYRGRQTVPVRAIVGSVNRYQDFDRAFMPRDGVNASRWKAINRAYYHFQDLPPVQLYQVGDVFFVMDGHNRVSVAREHGVEFIDADVLEVKARVPLTPDVDADDLELLGEYDGFLERTQLDCLRTGQNVSLTVAGGYQQLLEHIAVHGIFMAQDQGREVTEPEAVAHWYDAVFMPVVQIIRRRGILDEFPGRTEADLYLWLMDHLYYLRQRGGQVDPQEAAQQFAQDYGKRDLRNLRRRLYRAFANAALNDRPAPGLLAPPNLEEV
jgi:hypothetical protein